MVPIDPQNSLLVFGTEAGVKELRDIIAVLNRPLRQIEVEARLILIQSANLTGIWADLAAQADNNRPAMGFFDSDTEKQVTEMLVRNQAKILASSGAIP
jgi:type II secretory pathway component GspD/PulD (secretin)